MDYKETSIKVLRFSGNKDQFLIWCEKFKAKAMIVGGLDILTGIEKMPSKADFEAALAKEDTSSITAEETKTLKNYRAGIKMFSQLILSVDTSKASGKVAFEHIKQSKTTANPDGDPYLAWQNLIKKYEAKLKLQHFTPFCIVTCETLFPKYCVGGPIDFSLIVK